MVKRVDTPYGRRVDRRVTPRPRAVISAGKGAGTAFLTLLGVVLPTLLAWLMDPAHVNQVLSQFPINPLYAALIVSLVTGLAKFAWDYVSRKVKSGDWGSEV